MRRSAAFLTGLVSRGRHHFTTAEAQLALGGSVPAVRAALRRMKEREEIADPHRGFHVVVPPEYRRLGCLPPEQFVPALMDHLGEIYHVALLSAAELFGATHHRPQAFQVMLKGNRRPIECGQVRVDFIARRDIDRVSTVGVNTPRGEMQVSTPEATALELVGYADRCGGLDNVGSVLSELTERLDPSKLVSESRLCPVSWVQRLGFLLDLTDHEGLAEHLIGEVKERAAFVAPLVRNRTTGGAKLLKRWKLAVNAEIEPDL